MIFASVGSMLPFDRFVKAIDDWARDQPAESVYIQIGDGAYEPRHAPFTRLMPMSEYRNRLRDCRLFVAHVGMGSILQALEERKQMLLLPRRHELGEHTTAHQMHTAARFRNRAGIKIVDDTDNLQREMSELLRVPLQTGTSLSAHASSELLARVTQFIAAA